MTPEATPLFPANGVEVELLEPAGGEYSSDGAFVAEGPEGGVVVNLDPRDIEGAPGEFQDIPHEANLAEHLPDDILNSIGSSLSQAIDQDLESRREWEQTLATGIRYLGTQLTEQRTRPFKGSSGVYDSVMLTANVRFQSTAYGELQPASGPAKTQVIGSVTEENSARASRVKSFLNLYLTDLAPEYQPEFRRMLWWVGLEGGCFKKIYQDPALNRPVSAMIRSVDVILPYGATDLQTSPRVTHRFPITKRELRQKQLSGEYLDGVALVKEEDKTSGTTDTVRQAVDQATGFRPTQADIDENYTFYETQAYLDIQGFEHTEPDAEGNAQKTGLPLPYRVTWDKNSQKVLAVYRDWDERDTSYQRQNLYVYFPFIPGMGFYGLGYAHLLGNTAMAATALRRQTIDAATLAMMPSGVRAKGARFADNNVQVQPLEFPEVDTGGMPIQQFILPFSFKGPDPTSIALLQETYKQGEQIASTSDIAIGEGRQDAPVGTTMALLEASTRVETSIVKGLHGALKLELRMVAALFGKYLPDREPYPFAVPGGEGFVMKSDFTGHIDVIPVSDPNIASGTQRMIRAQMLQQTALQAPQIHDIRQAYANLYMEMGMDQGMIDKILPPSQTAQPLDPLSENMNAMMGKPLAVGPAQNHAAHVQVHQALMQMPNMSAHIQEHLAWAQRIQVEQALGHPLPPPGTPMDPQMENAIAVQVAQVMAAMQAKAAAQAPGGAEDSQTALAEKALQTQLAATAQKASQAQIQANVEMQKQAMKSQDAALDRENRFRIAELKATATEEVHGITPNFPEQ